MIASLLNKLKSSNITLTLNGSNLHYRAPTGLMTSDLKTEIKKYKSELIAHLKTEDSTNAQKPLSFSQQRLFLLDKMIPTGNIFNVFQALDIKGYVAEDDLKKAVSKVVKRHNSLRTSFVENDGTAYLNIEQNVEIPFETYDFSASSNPLEEAKKVLSSLSEYNFDLAKTPLMRCCLCHISAEKTILGILIHHIIADGWSIGVLIDEIGFYLKNDDKELEPLAIQYEDFAVSNRKYLTGDAIENELSFWKTYLKDFPPISTFPSDFTRPSEQSFDGKSLKIPFDEELSSKIKQLVKTQKISLNTLFFSIYSVLMYNYTNQNDIVVGLPIAGRNKPELHNLIGMFVNVLPFRIKLEPSFTFKELVSLVSKQMGEILSHAEMPFEYLVSKLDIERNLSLSPLFQNTINFMPPITSSKFGNYDYSFVEYDSKVSKQDLTFYFEEFNNQIVAFVEYVSKLYSEETIKNLVDSFSHILKTVAENFDITISNLNGISPRMHDILINQWQGKKEDLKPRSIAQYILDAANKTPKALALRDDEKTITYEEFSQSAQKLASLLKAKGLNKGDNVIIFMEKSVDTIIAMLGTMIAGGAYVPTVPSTPTKRFKYILDDSDAKFIISSTKISSEYDELISSSITKIVLKNEDLEKYSLWQDNLPSEIDPAYVIYTSGSTGKPKGVLVSSKGFAALELMLDNIIIEGKNNVAQCSNLMFDASILEIWGNLSKGLFLTFLPNNLILDYEKLKSWINTNQINYMLATSVIAEQLYNMEWEKDTPLKCLFFGGEAVTSSSLETTPFECYNLYGPSENTVVSSYKKLEKGKDGIPSIGKPISNVSCYILNNFLQPVPIGGIGELYLGGDSLALKYLGNEKLNEERFCYWSPQTYLKDPKQTDAIRIYKTGDLVRYDNKGELQFVGRTDNQVKIRGFRIEIGEIEAVLNQHKEVSAAAVKVINENNNKFLAAWVECQNQNLNSADFKDFLSDKLPSYMIPSQIELIKKIPLTSNNKIDYKALKLSLNYNYNQNQTKPLNQLEQIIAEIWKSLLGNKSFSSNDNFFDLGGHSLMMAKISNLILEKTGKKVEILDLFRYPTIAKLASFLGGEEKAANFNRHSASNTSDIAVIGMAGRFPKAKNIDELWQNLLDGKNCISHFTKEELLQAGNDPELINDEDYVPANGVLDDFEFFDADFFNISPKDALTLDPQHRILMETSWLALEDAGYNPETFQGLIGIYAGSGFNSYFLKNIYGNEDFKENIDDFQILINSSGDFLTTRIAYKLNLKGPAVNINTGCSTSLVTIHSAVSALINNECDIALAGGVRVNARQVEGYIYEEGSISSKTGRCLAFDEKADGTVVGNGSGIVVLKKLDAALRDNDHIYAVVKGSAINNDGCEKIGFSAPSIEGQKQVISLALNKAGYEPETINYVETHGTGTALGDPIEFTALKETLDGKNRKEQCYLGTIKTSIGHLDSAAGVAGFIKAVKVMEKSLIPPNYGFEKPIPSLGVEKTHLAFPKECIELKSPNHSKRACVSSFGIGGTNAFIILEEAPKPKNDDLKQDGTPNLLLISGKTEISALKQTDSFIKFLKANPSLNLDNAAYTTAIGRKHFDFRKAAVGVSPEDIISYFEINPNTEKTPEDLKPIFMFTGQGAQYKGMMKELYNKVPYFRDTLDLCFKIAEPLLPVSLKDVIFEESSEEHLSSTSYAQPALFAIEYALAKYLMSLGIIPQAMIGHSIGQWVAACLADVFSLEDALNMVILRGRLMNECAQGKMLAISLPENDVLPYLNSKLNLAAINASNQSVVAGTDDAIDTLKNLLVSKEIRCSEIPNSKAFHSFIMDPALKPFTEALAKVQTGSIKIPIISNLNGKFLTDSEASSPEYWAAQIRNPVRFAEGIKTLASEKACLLIEVGPARVLSSLALRNELKNPCYAVPVIKKQGKGEYYDFLEALGQLWEKGLNLNWEKLYEGRNLGRISLPTYQFDRKYFFIDNKKTETPIKNTEENKTAKKAISIGQEATVIAEAMAKVLGINNVGLNDDFFQIGGDSLSSVQLNNLLKRTYGIKIPTSYINIQGTPNKIAAAFKNDKKDAALDNNNDDEKETSIVTQFCQGQKTEPKLFFVHAIGGGAFVFRDLINAMESTYPSYGISSKGLWNDDDALDSIEKMADYYLEAIEQYRNEQPITLIGYSFGGYVAYEMALRMQEKGLSFNPVIMLDTPAPQYKHYKIRSNKDLFAYLLDLDDIGKNFAKHQKNMENLDEDACFEYVLNEIKNSHSGYKNITMQELKKRIKVLLANHNAMENYFPRKSNLKINFMKAAIKDEFNDQSPSEAWNEYTNDGVTVFDVPGNHSSMLSPPNTTDLAKKIISLI
ncbi:MAG: amino acid adenylation domain-containing protein [Alphaproteobacteria bacterium]